MYVTCHICTSLNRLNSCLEYSLMFRLQLHFLVYRFTTNRNKSVRNLVSLCAADVNEFETCKQYRNGVIMLQLHDWAINLALLKPNFGSYNLEARRSCYRPPEGGLQGMRPQNFTTFWLMSSLLPRRTKPSLHWNEVNEIGNTIIVGVLVYFI